MIDHRSARQINFDAPAALRVCADEVFIDPAQPWPSLNLPVLANAKPINPSTGRTAPATIIQSGYSIAESRLIRAPYFCESASQRSSRAYRGRSRAVCLNTIAIRPAGSRSAGFSFQHGQPKVSAPKPKSLARNNKTWTRAFGKWPLLGI
jgi:hypothetical protein